MRDGLPMAFRSGFVPGTLVASWQDSTSLCNDFLTRNKSVNEWFRKFANKTSEIVGSPWAFIAAVALIVGWAASGPVFGFSEVWQLVINTGTTIITFLMV